MRIHWTADRREDLNGRIAKTEQKEGLKNEELEIGTPAETSGGNTQALTPLRMDLTLSYSPLT
jgi:hypothetical protein